jgi:lipopolysaccharide/colanic/teichoic acid biosynthesis glycosyltransferase
MNQLKLYFVSSVSSVSSPGSVSSASSPGSVSSAGSTNSNHSMISPLTLSSPHAYDAKGLLDVSVASLACLLCLALIAAAAALKWLEDGRSPFFVQVRLGRGRRPFTIIKLRTMLDQQVTPFGALLRSSGLDEIPQLLNVLKGDMSIVGPRPLTAYDIDRLGWNSAAMDWRFAANPGITGISQLLAGRSARLSRRLDRLYLQKAGLILDLKLITTTAAVSVVGKRRVRRWLSPVTHARP